MEELPTALLKVSRSAPLPPTKVELVTVPVREKRSSPVATMQEGVFDTSSDIDGVITAVGLDVRVSEGIANLNAVFALTTEDGRVNSWSS